MHDNITTDINTHLAVLMADLKDLVCQWRELGLQLGLNYFKLREIETNRRECMLNGKAEYRAVKY